jgi:hypothetical protein
VLLIAFTVCLPSVIEHLPSVNKMQMRRGSFRRDSKKQWCGASRAMKAASAATMCNGTLFQTGMLSFD